MFSSIIATRKVRRLSWRLIRLIIIFLESSKKKPIMGGYTTDFTLIKAGSISRANGGYLILYDRDVLANAGVWEALQRVIKNRELKIEEPAAFFGFVPPQGLRPEPIPTDTKII